MGGKIVGSLANSHKDNLTITSEVRTMGQVRKDRILGFALAKGLVRGLTRCPNPSS